MYSALAFVVALYRDWPSGVVLDYVEEGSLVAP
jgi:hypothetical protein